MKTKKLKWFISLIFFLIFALISFLVLYDKTLKFDNTIYNYLQIHHNPNFTKVIIFITNLASEITLIILTLLIFIIIKNKKIGFMTLLNLVFVLILNQGLKFLFLRERPSEMIINVTGYSYPSGHSMASFAFYGLIIYFIHKTKVSKFIKNTLSIFLIMLILSIGFSRVYLHVHYASDVIAGYFLAASYLIIFIDFSEKYLLGGKKNE